jgi:hypothetical protein
MRAIAGGKRLLNGFFVHVNAVFKLILDFL